MDKMNKVKEVLTTGRRDFKVIAQETGTSVATVRVVYYRLKKEGVIVETTPLKRGRPRTKTQTV